MKHTLLNAAAAFMLLSILALQSANACLWDRDTLAMEAENFPGLTEIITGRFDRFPPLHYEMRLERVAKELESEPDNLSLYDDAAVACDRLGRSDEAIEWMAKKRAMLDTLAPLGGDLSHHEYTYLANLGTFHIHRWIKNGADRTNMSDVERSQELIAAAIELNPDAHFGRERYQLLAIDWLLSDETHPANNHGTLLNLIPEEGYATDFHIGYNRRMLSSLGYKDAVQGLSGLIILGNAWESIDIYLALAYALIDQGNSLLAQLAITRVLELYDAGAKSLSTNLFPEDINGSSPFVHIESAQYLNKITTEYFPAARTEANRWTAARNAYATERLQQGLHPDTNPDFWDAWHESTSPPDYPKLSWMARNPLYAGMLTALLSVTAVIAILIAFLWIGKRGSGPPALPA